MRTRNILFITAGVVGAGVGGAAIVAAIDDPEVAVDPVEASGIEIADASTTGSDASAPAGAGTAATAAPPGNGGSTSDTAPSVEQVDGLEQLVGTLRVSDDGDDWYVLGVEVDFGPEEWVFSAPAFADYDGDGTAEPLLAELRGLEGRDVTFGVRYDLDDDDLDDAYVFTINGLLYRDTSGGPAPWQATDASSRGADSSEQPVTDGPISADEAKAIGATAAGGNAIDVWPGTEDGRSVYYVDVRTTDGLVEVYVDADTGEIVTIEPGD